MPTNADLLALEEQKKNKPDELLNKPMELQKDIINPEPKGILKKGGKLVGNALSIKGMYDEAVGVKTNIDYLTGNVDKEGMSKDERTATTISSIGNLTRVTAEVGGSLTNRAIKKTGEKAAKGLVTKKAADTTKKSLTKVGSTLGKVASSASAIVGVADFAGAVAREKDAKSDLRSGRGFEGQDVKDARQVGLIAKGAGAVAGVGMAVGAILGGAASVAATNFWNPVGWVAAGVGILAAGFQLLKGKNSSALR
tara:strand:- start:475 stop:1233 length:759 start_codon:yes stop_codon:yes gene_type:complete